MQPHATYNISFKYLQILPYPSSVVGSLELGFARSPSSMMNPATTSSSETWPLPSWSCTTQFGNFQRRSKRSWHSIVSNCTTIHTSTTACTTSLRHMLHCHIAVDIKSSIPNHGRAALPRCFSIITIATSNIQLPHRCWVACSHKNSSVWEKVQGIQFQKQKTYSRNTMQSGFGGEADPKFWAGMAWETAVCRKWFKVGLSMVGEWQEYCGLGAIW